MFCYLEDPNGHGHRFDSVKSAAKYYAKITARRGKKAKKNIATLTYDTYEGIGFEFKGKHYRNAHASVYDDDEEQTSEEMNEETHELAQMMRDLGVEHVRDPENADQTRLYTVDEWESESMQ